MTCELAMVCLSLQAIHFPPSMIPGHIILLNKYQCLVLHVVSHSFACENENFGNIRIEFGDSDKHKYRYQQSQSLFQTHVLPLADNKQVFTTVSKQNSRKSNFLVITRISTVLESKSL